MVMVNADGWRVEKVVRQVADGLPEVRLRVSWRGYWQADCLDTAEVAELVELSTLVPSVTHLHERAYLRSPWVAANKRVEAAMAEATAQAAPPADRQESTTLPRR